MALKKTELSKSAVIELHFKISAARSSAASDLGIR